jgi:hypothetical protein
MAKRTQRTVTLPEKIFKIAKEDAQKEKRSVSNYVTKLLLEARER